jgi:hypothetical protein
MVMPVDAFGIGPALRSLSGISSVDPLDHRGGIAKYDE